jgi:hypothetical protein
MTVFILFLHSDYVYEIRTSEQTRCWVNIGFGSGLSTVASDRAPEREACSARARFVGTIIFKKIVRRRNFMKNTILITSLAAAFGLSINAAAQSSAAQQGAPTVKTGSALKAKAASPAPSATAKNKSQKTTIGKGKAAAKTSAPSSYWTEEVDVHDDGSVETSEFLRRWRSG